MPAANQFASIDTRPLFDPSRQPVDGPPELMGGTGAAVLELAGKNQPVKSQAGDGL
jgi:hypothetical protein